MSVDTAECSWEKLIFCDLDGTLIARGRSLSEANCRAIVELRRRNIGVVAVSGRSFSMLTKVVPPEVPLAFAVCSTGAGVLSWPDLKLLRCRNIEKSKCAEAISLFVNRKVDFAVFSALPENSVIGTYAADPQDENKVHFHRSIKAHYNIKECELPIESWMCEGGEAGHLLAAFNEDEESKAEALRIELEKNGHSVIRATSPVDDKSIWIEVFAEGVGKAAASEWIVKNYAANAETYAIGNDYNDLDLLSWAEKSCLSSLATKGMDSAFTKLDAPIENTLPEAAKIWGLL
jgi:HAD superfamily hydrolase (TIGR01484 family)